MDYVQQYLYTTVIYINLLHQYRQRIEKQPGIKYDAEWARPDIQTVPAYLKPWFCAWNKPWAYVFPIDDGPSYKNHINHLYSSQFSQKVKYSSVFDDIFRPGSGENKCNQPCNRTHNWCLSKNKNGVQVSRKIFVVLCKASKTSCMGEVRKIQHGSCNMLIRCNPTAEG